MIRQAPLFSQDCFSLIDKIDKTDNPMQARLM